MNLTNLDPIPPIKPITRPAALPQSRRRPWTLLLALLALAAGGVVTWAGPRFWQGGVAVTVSFPEAHGLRPGAPVRCQGVEVGKVTQVALARNHRVAVRLVLHPDSAGLARRGSRWWIARPLFRLADGLTGLDTALGDGYVAVQPGTGEPVGDVEGEESPPQPEPAPGSLRLSLRAKHRPDGARVGAPVTCRGITIGRVTGAELARDGSKVRIRVQIDPPYVHLVRQGIRFRDVDLVTTKGSIVAANFRAQVNLQALAGGLDMEAATVSGPPIPEGTELDLAGP